MGTPRGGHGARAPGTAPAASVTDPLVPLRTARDVSGRGDAECNAARNSSRMAELDTPHGLKAAVLARNA